MRYYGGYKGLVVCRTKFGCNGRPISGYYKLPKANLVTIDFRKDNMLNTHRNLNLFKRLGIIKRPSWSEYEAVIYRLLLNPCPTIQEIVERVTSQVPSKWFSVATHVRFAGYLANSKEKTMMVRKTQLPFIAKMIRDVLNQNKVNNTQTVFIATDSSYGLKKLKTLLYPIQVLSNQQVKRGHSTGAKRNVVHSTLADLFLLTRSKTLIGVDRSGFSYVAKALSRPKVVKWIHVY